LPAAIYSTERQTRMDMCGGRLLRLTGQVGVGTCRPYAASPWSDLPSLNGLRARGNTKRGPHLRGPLLLTPDS